MKLCVFLIFLASIAILGTAERTDSQEQVKVKYRHRRENDDDENFIALAPAEGDDFNLETVLTKDKELPPPVVQLDPVNVNDYGNNNEMEQNDKFNRYFDNGDINEESRMVMNETQPNPIVVKWSEDDGNDDNDDADDGDDEDDYSEITTTSTTTVSPYVQEIFRTKHHRNHRFKKKFHKQHHRQHHNIHSDNGRIYSYPHKPSYRTIFPQGRVSFFDNSNRLQTPREIDRHLSGYTSRDKWPYFTQVKNHLDDENEELPPYIKKYNRRNKQLMNLLDGTLAPPPHKKKKHEHRYHRRKNPHWLEEDLFEEQRPNRNYGLVYEVTTRHPNELPSDDDDADNDDEPMKINDAIHTTFNQSLLATNNHPPPFKISSRAGQFVYHTVTAVPEAAEASSAGTGVKKKRLPFVAITDRRVGPPKSRRNNNIINNINSNSEQNHLPLP